MTDNLFDQNNTDNDRIEIDPNKNYLEEYVGEGKKFKTQEDLAKAKHESDLYIKTLESRLDEMRRDNLSLREEYNKGARLEELIETLKNQQLASSNQNQNANEDLDKPTFDPKKVEDLIVSRIQAHETEKKQRENFSLVMNKLRDVYGNNYQTILKEQANALGLEETFINDLARNHPAVLFRTLGLDRQNNREEFQPPVRSQNTFQPQVKKRTWSYYQQMKKDNPRLYNDPKTIVQMHKDAVELGEEFQDGNFHSI